MYNDNNGTDYSSGSYNKWNWNYSYIKCIIIIITITIKIKSNKLVELIVKGCKIIIIISIITLIVEISWIAIIFTENIILPEQQQQ